MAVDMEHSLDVLRELKTLLYDQKREDHAGLDRGDVEGTQSPTVTPSISPMDHSQFLKRFDSFTIQNWCRMPPELSPLICASKGWSYQKSDTLLCCFCQQSLYLTLPSRHQEFFNKKVKEYVEQLSRRHSVCCPWSSVECPVYFLTDSLPNRPSHMDRVISRAQEYSQNSLMIEILTETGVQCTPTLSSHMEDIQTISRSLSVNVKCLIIALQGWKIQTVMTSSVLMQCDLCRRRLSVEKQSDRSVDLTKHLSWCPWMSAVKSESQPLSQAVLSSLQVKFMRKRKSCSSGESTEPQEMYKTVKDIRRFLRDAVSLRSPL